MTDSRLLDVANRVVGYVFVIAFHVVFGLSIAALVFAGDAAAAFPRGAGSFLVANGLVAVIITLRFPRHRVVGGLQDNASVIVAASLGGVIAGLDQAPAVSTALVYVALVTLAVGVAHWAIGRARLAGAVRFIPQPVVAGFAAATGWLLARGGLEVAIGRSVGADDLDVLVDGSTVRLWLPAALVAVTVCAAIVAPVHPAFVSGAIAASFVGFFVVLWTVSSVGRAEADGWFLGPFGSDTRFAPVGPSDLAATDWGAVAAQWPTFAAVVVIATVAVLLNVTTLEYLGDDELDLDHQLRSSGVANVGAGLLGSGVGFHHLSDTLLARRVGILGMGLSGGVAAASVAVVLFGGRLIELFPRAVAGGTLGALGLSLLWGWVTDAARNRSTVAGPVISGLIVAMTVFVGILEAVGVGIVAAAALFVFQYSRIDPIRHRLSGRDARSRVDRGTGDLHVLDAHGERTDIAVLEGYLFFGSLATVVELLRQVTDSDEVDNLVIDFARVSGLDVSASEALARGIGRATAAGATVILSGGGGRVGLDAIASAATEHGCTVVADLDAALELCERRTLDRHGAGAATNLRIDLDGLLDGQGTEFLRRCQRQEIDAGTTLMAQGDESDAMYFIEAGTLVVTVASTTGRPDRLRTIGPGAPVGELGFATGDPRTADVTAATDAVVHRLDRAAFDRLWAADPELAQRFQTALVRLMAERLATTNRAVQALLR